MNNFSWWENLVCKNPINIAESYRDLNKDLSNRLFRAQTELNDAIREKDSIIKSASQSNAEKLKKIDELETKISELNAAINTLNQQINALNQQINQNVMDDSVYSRNFKKLPADAQSLAVRYLNKYPEARVTYSGRYWGDSKTVYRLDVKAWLLQGQNDWEITSKVRERKARVADVLNEQPNLTFHQACDIAFMRVTNAFGDSIRYTFDHSLWGAAVPEFWQFASETNVIGRGDCEDKAILNEVACIAAGIPEEIMRVTAGMTYSNEGHCTNFYFASDLRWHHRNSTTFYQPNKPATSLPLTGDSSENLNIKTPWFSATPSKTFNWFGTEAQKKQSLLDMANDEFGKFLNILK